MPQENKVSSIYAINSKSFSEKYKLRNLIPRKKSNGPSEVWKSILDSNFDNSIKIVKSKKSTWPPSQSRVIIVGDFIDQIPEKLISRLAECQLLLGPNIDFKLKRNYQYIDSFRAKKILVPSQWVRSYLIESLKINEKVLVVWPSGVNVEYWLPNKSIVTKNTVLIYQKTNKYTKLITDYCRVIKDFGLTPIVVKYGMYKQVDYKSYLEKSKFLVWFGETESQSMAQFQAWAMDVPTLVLRVEKYNDGESSYNASSSPYLNSETGEFFDSGLPSHNVINSWLDRLNTFSPRNWILKGHTLIYAKNKLEKIYESLNYQSN
jgi:hypothetical protein